MNPLVFCLTLFAANVPTGPNPGAPIPAFTLQDQSGKPRSFADLKGPKGLMLVFFRSADW